jgi:type IV pilus assembly protein PilA
MHKPQRGRQRGQGMTEYIIVVALLGIATTGVYTLYGRVMRHQTAAVAASVGGDDVSAKDANKSGNTAAKLAPVEAAAEINLKNFSEPASTK